MYLILLKTPIIKIQFFKETWLLKLIFNLKISTIQFRSLKYYIR